MPTHAMGWSMYMTQGVISAKAVVACPLGNDVFPRQWSPLVRIVALPGAGSTCCRLERVGKQVCQDERLKASKGRILYPAIILEERANENHDTGRSHGIRIPKLFNDPPHLPVMPTLHGGSPSCILGGHEAHPHHAGTYPRRGPA